jgi:1-aminocyclopropane-1-carboxylate deaminase/D-cysteine desulfhydrase-like pyridoxal-dependent ACC family enzyme
VLTVGAAQSNHARQTAAAARKLGLRCILVLARSQHNELQGNLLLDELLGADVRLIDPTPGYPPAAAMQAFAEEEARKGHRPYLIPGGGSNGVGGLGYVRCVLEMAQQLLDAEVTADYVYVSSGSGGTQGGLLLGKELYHTTYEVVGLSPGGQAQGVRAACARVANEGASLLGVDLRFSPDEVIVHDEYVGPGYAIPTPASSEAVRLFARTEGIIIDPVYTAKAAAGLIDHIRQGRIRLDQTVIFLHTGGTPALFAYHQETAQALGGQPT